VFRVRHESDPEGERFDTATQALRRLARIVRSAPLTPGERRAFEQWYTHRNYRSTAHQLRVAYRSYRIAFSVNGVRQTYVIEPCAHMPQDPVGRVILRAQDGSETPRTPRNATG